MFHLIGGLEIPLVEFQFIENCGLGAFRHLNLIELILRCVIRRYSAVKGLNSQEVKCSLN